MIQSISHLKFRTVFFFLVLLLGFSYIHGEDIAYKVKFEGVENEDILCTLNSVSELVTLSDLPPATVTALRRRADADISNLIRGLHSFAYYHAKIDFDINTDCAPAIIVVKIDLGPIYPIANFIIQPDCEETTFPFETIKLKKLGIIIGSPALPKTIIEAENTLLELLAKQSYPLAKIEKREVVADQITKSINVTLQVSTGPVVYFGETTISGHCKVDESVIRKKICWCEGQPYDPNLIEKTFCDIELSGLFCSVAITPAEKVEDECYLPINIEVIEGRHRTVGFGVGYNTQVGPGFIGIWEHRNMRSLGEKLSFKADVAVRCQTGTLLYRQPDFMSPKQDLVWIAEVENENTKGFSDTAFSYSGIIDRELDCHSKFSYGGTIKQLHTEHSNNNRQFLLLKSPLFYRWSNANDLLDPTRGGSVIIKFTPTYQVVNPQTTYFITTITGTGYRALTKDRRFVLAFKGSLGSIFGASDISIPPPERFYIGSENTLRGYNYLTVSPLDGTKPIGGRSMMVFTAEARWRITDSFGTVLFYDVGNVYEQILPQFNFKQLQSIGTGLRYHTPVGPLRFDIAFPLNRRKGIDRAFQFYFNIGQAF